jgi:uncharacterized membrane protein
MKFFSSKVGGLTRLTLLGCFLLISTSAALADRIKSFDSTIKLSKDGTASIEEKMVIDFGTNSRHGIRRFIPVVYNRKGGTYTIPLKFTAVKDQNGNPYHFETRQVDRNILLQIGDPNVQVSGVKTYKIDYDVRRAINYFDGAPEFYWNVNGNESKFAVDSVSAKLTVPADVPLKDIKTTSYVGYFGSPRHAAVKREANDIVFSAKNLAPGEGMTIVAALPKGAIPMPTKLQQATDSLIDWYPLYVLPLGTSIMLYLYWLFQGKDKGGRRAVGVEFTPPYDLTPAEVGTLIDEKIDMPDVTSTLVDLAARGYLKIRQLPYNGILMMSDKDYEFTKLSPPAGAIPLKQHETFFMAALFGYLVDTTYLSSLQGKFQPHIIDIKTSIWSQLLNGGYFTRHPDSDRAFFRAIGLFLILLAGLYMMLNTWNEAVAGAGGLVISGLITMLSSGAMPSRTEKGSKALGECLSFKRFVEKAEKKRIAVLAKEDPTIFGRLLPYAMVLGCADTWAEKFKELLVAPPDWYQPYNNGNSCSTFDPVWYFDDLGQGMYSIQSGFSQAPVIPSSSSSGGGGGGDGGWGGFGGGGGFSGFDGGFSGGGFGGGGTDSW